MKINLDFSAVRLADRLDLKGVQVHDLLLLAANVDLRCGASWETWKKGQCLAKSMFFRFFVNLLFLKFQIKCNFSAENSVERLHESRTSMNNHMRKSCNFSTK